MFFLLCVNTYEQRLKMNEWSEFKVFVIYHASSETSWRTGFSPAGVLTVAWLTSGYWVDEWLPQIMTFFTSETWTFNLSEIWPKALLWSSLVKQEMFLSGIDGANSFKINALVFAGLATTRTCKIFQSLL